MVLEIREWQLFYGGQWKKGGGKLIYKQIEGEGGKIPVQANWGGGLAFEEGVVK